MGHTGFTFKELKELFRYEERSGQLLWYCRRPGVRAGTPAGFMFNGNKYVTVDGVRVLVKKIVWTLCTGTWPRFTVHHANGNHADCAWGNLTDKKPEKPAPFLEIHKTASGALSVRLDGKTIATDSDPEKILSCVRALLVY